MASGGDPDRHPIAVLHVLEAIRGGTSRHVADVVRNTSGIQHHVAVPVSDRSASAAGAVVDRPALDALSAAGAVVHHLEMRRTPLHPANMAAIRRLRRLLRTVRPDLVHGHSAVGGAIARLAAAGLGIPVFYTPHALSQNRIALMIERGLRPLTTKIVAVSPSEARLALDLKLVREGQVAVIPNGIDLDAPTSSGEDLRALAGIPEHARVVGTVIRLVPQKAPTLFVDVCSVLSRQYPDLHYVLIGLGPLQSDVEDAVAQAGLAHRWHQIRHLPDAAPAIGQMDVFVLLSSYEGGPYAPLEAMRAGTPVVLTDVVGNHDVVEAGVSGLVAPFGDVGALAAAVSMLLSDGERAGAIAAASRRRLEEFFDVRRMGHSLEQLYRQAVDGVAPSD